MAKEVIVTTGIAYSVLAPGVKITGDIFSDSDIRMEGVLIGNLTCDGKVILGPQASLKGDLKCANAEISGILEGDIESREQLTLRENSRISGAVKTSILVIEPGASFNGACEMYKKEAEG